MFFCKNVLIFPTVRNMLIEKLEFKTRNDKCLQSKSGNFVIRVPCLTVCAQHITHVMVEGNRAAAYRNRNVILFFKFIALYLKNNKHTKRLSTVQTLCQ